MGTPCGMYGLRRWCATCPVTSNHSYVICWWRIDWGSRYRCRGNARRFPRSTVVQEVRYIASVDRSDEVGGCANVLLCGATPGPQLSSLKVASSVEWVGFAPNPGITSIGDNVLDGKTLRVCASIRSVNLHGLSNVTTIGKFFLLGCRGLSTINLSPFSNVTALDHAFLPDCAGLTTIDLRPLSNITAVGERFLYGCRGLTSIDLSPLSNITAVGRLQSSGPASNHS